MAWYRLRTTSELPATVNGTSSSFEVYIQIQWAWMIVPIATLVLSLILLLLTIYLSRRSRIPAWKSSLLAVMFSLNSETRRDVGGMANPLSMEERAKGRRVRLVAEGGQWSILKTDWYGEVFEYIVTQVFKMNGLLEKAGARVVSPVVPRLIETSELEGWSVKPVPDTCGRFADLWDGNAGTSYGTGDFIVFDADRIGLCYTYNDIFHSVNHILRERSVWQSWVVCFHPQFEPHPLPWNLH